MWRGRRLPADEELLRGLATMIMRIDAKLDRVLELLGEDVAEAELDA
jgi:hypothetical protein